MLLCKTRSSRATAARGFRAAYELGTEVVLDKASLAAAVAAPERAEPENRAGRGLNVSSSQSARAPFQVMRKDPPMFFKYYRMSPDKFDFLHRLVMNDLIRQFLCREPLCSEERLAITIRVLWNRLKPLYLPVPGLALWQEVAEGFAKRWNFPNCLGAVDGKHIQIKAPPNSGSNYYNYKGTFSIVLMAVADDSYKFVMVDVGAPGRHSDGGVFKATSFGKGLMKNCLNLPAPARLPKSNKVAPHVFVGDEAFQLRQDFMRPYPGKGLQPSQKVFNYRLSRARRIVENAFGILVARWRVLLGRLNLLPSIATHVVLACCALHNFLCSTSKATYSPPGYVDGEDCYGNVNPGQWRKEAQVNELCDLEGTSSRNYTVDAAQTRNLFAKYFMAEGAVPWQWAHTYLPTPCNA
ncbi:hypothetical protein HPB49_023148 [Dermacentor silvarum]|uniref:Uncharacterized protein n=1 Tax=Dermacentor silvarum TaxID=543639 RepID=A0ACB8CTH6_DERSI|nr:hypothetical protein HPB49_023148 [Dermacentor silvarum]